LSITTIKRVLERQGLTVEREKTKKPSPEVAARDEQIQKLFKQGLTKPQLAIQFEVSISTIERALKKQPEEQTHE
jgi:DNA invertase Pin-like site-specific DNA recombinase